MLYRKMVEMFVARYNFHKILYNVLNNRSYILSYAKYEPVSRLLILLNSMHDTLFILF